MSDDFIESSFADLDVFYPGSKRKRREPKVVETRESQLWDSRPYLKTLPNGREIEMFTVGALANALGRPFITIRKWNEEGYLPSSPYRLPTKKNKNGDDHKGRRLYSRAMIETAVELFDKAGLLNVKRIEWSLHQKLVKELAEAWTNILAQETKNQETQGDI
jgi:hypothetical protein